MDFGPGALNMLQQALRDETHKDHSVYLRGDLCQMSAQANFLTSHGVDVKFNNVYPCVKPCDEEKTFKLLWKFKLEGWWHYDNQYIELSICTKEEFEKALHK